MKKFLWFLKWLVILFYPALIFIYGIRSTVYFFQFENPFYWSMVMASQLFNSLLAPFITIILAWVLYQIIKLEYSEVN